MKAHDHALDALRYALHTHFGTERLTRTAKYFIGHLQRRIEVEDDAAVPHAAPGSDHDVPKDGLGDSG